MIYFSQKCIFYALKFVYAIHKLYGLDGGNSQIFQNKAKKQSAAGSFPVHFCTLRVFLKSSIAYFEEAICIGLRLIGDEFVVLFH